MSTPLLATIVSLLLLTTLATLARGRAARMRKLHDERHRSRRSEIDHERDPGFHNRRAEELASEHETKRAAAQRAARVADVYTHLAEEQETKAARLSAESEEAAARAGLEDFRVRHLEADAEQPAPLDP